MAEKNYEIPVLEDHLPTPIIRPDALVHVQSHPAKPALQEALGFPTELVDDWEAKAVAKLGRRDIRCLLVGSDQGRRNYRKELDSRVQYYY